LVHSGADWARLTPRLVHFVAIRTRHTPRLVDFAANRTRLWRHAERKVRLEANRAFATLVFVRFDEIWRELFRAPLASDLFTPWLMVLPTDIARWAPRLMSLGTYWAQDDVFRLFIWHPLCSDPIFHNERLVILGDELHDTRRNLRSFLFPFLRSGSFDGRGL